MKKVIFIFIFVILGVNYSFSQTWWDVIIDATELVIDIADDNSNNSSLNDNRSSGNNDNYEIMFLAYGAGTSVPNWLGVSPTGHIFIAFMEFGKITKVNGHHPDGLADDTELIQYADRAFKINVSRDELNQAMLLNPGDYILGDNDCVSYASEIAYKIGLNRPSYDDYIVTPVGYIKYLISHNSMCRILK